MQQHNKYCGSDTKFLISSLASIIVKISRARGSEPIDDSSTIWTTINFRLALHSNNLNLSNNWKLYLVYRAVEQSEFNGEKTSINRLFLHVVYYSSTFIVNNSATPIRVR